MEVSFRSLPLFLFLFFLFLFLFIFIFFKMYVFVLETAIVDLLLIKVTICLGVTFVSPSMGVAVAINQPPVRCTLYRHVHYTDVDHLSTYNTSRLFAKNVIS